MMKRWKVVLSAAVILMTLLLAGCGSGGGDSGYIPVGVTPTPTSTYKVSGAVTVNGTGVSGVTVSTSGGTVITTTDSNGDYAISGLASGSYTLTPAKTGYTFTPASQSVMVNGAHVTNQIFSASVPLITYLISGTIHSVSNSGPALSGATVSIAGKTATTSSTGVFSIADIPAGTYAFSVSNSGYDAYTNPAYYVGSNQTSLSFYLTQPAVTYAMSGTIHSVSNSGPALSGAKVSIAGINAFCNTAGVFSISGIPAGTYQLTVDKAGYSTYTNPAYYVGSNQTSLSFYLTQPTQLNVPTISSPTANAVLTNYPRTATLSWSSVTGATSYEIEIALGYPLTSPVYGSPTTYIAYTNSYTTPALAGDNPFRFRVRAKNASTTGAWSSYRYFSYNTASDSISIISISPTSAVANHVTSFAVKVSYSLTSKNSGLLMVGFNTNQVNSFSMISSQEYIVTKGSGTHTFNVTTTPVNWGSAGSFKSYVNLSENPHPSSWSPLDTDTITISTSPSVAKSLLSTDAPSQCENNTCF